MKFFEGVRRGPRTKCSDFGGDPVPDQDPEVRHLVGGLCCLALPALIVNNCFTLDRGYM